MEPDPWEFVPPTFCYRPEYEYSLGAEVADLNALLGFAPDAEQELILELAFAVAADGLPAASRGAVVASRQTVKSSGLEMVALGWMLLTQEPVVLWSAHELKTARETFLHMQRLLEARPWTRRRIRQTYTGINDMGFAFVTGQRLMFAARTTDSGRGKTAPKTIRDEELETRDEHIAASAAVTSTFPWAQTLAGSSGAKDYSEVLWRAINRGRAQEPGRYFHLEWVDDKDAGQCGTPDCAHRRDTPGCRLDSREHLRRSNPTVGRIRSDGRGLTWAAIADERGDLSPAAFARERLGWHYQLRADLVASKPFRFGDLVIDRASTIVGEPVFAVDVSPGAAWASIVVGGRNPAGSLHVEIPSHEVEVPRGGREWARKPGDGWVSGWFASRLDADDETTPTYERMRVLLLAGSDAESLAPALERIVGLEVEVVPWARYAAACGIITRLVRSGELVFVGDNALTDAAITVVRKPSTERATGWSRADSDDDITPWVAATLLAHHFAGEEDYDVLASFG